MENTNYWQKLQQLNEELLTNIKNNLPELEKLLIEITDHWQYEDLIYRFYHYSYKVYYIQNETIKIVNLLKELSPKDTTINENFEQIYKEGTGKIFNHTHNRNWLKHTRVLLEAFFHAKYFLEMAVKYGKELEKAPECLPSGWAGLLYLYNLR